MKEIIKELESDVERLTVSANFKACSEGFRDSKIDDNIRNKEILIIILKNLTSKTNSA